MKPPEGISQRLKAFDKDLRLRWNPSRNKWEVWCYPKGKRHYYVITVRNDDGSYRPPDNRIFAQLAFSDKTRFRNGAQQIAEIDNAFHQMKREKERELEDATHNDLADKLAWAIKRDFA